MPFAKAPCLKVVRQQHSAIARKKATFFVCQARIFFTECRQGPSQSPFINPFAYLQCNIVTFLVNPFTIIVQAHQASARAAASSTPTETRRDTPGSCMVTPIKRSDASMAILLWVI